MMTLRMMSLSSKFSLFHYCLFTRIPLSMRPNDDKTNNMLGNREHSKKKPECQWQPICMFPFFIYSPFYQFNKSEGQTTTGWTQAKTIETPVHVRQPLGNAGNQ